jgi:hypothetical protein
VHSQIGGKMRTLEKQDLQWALQRTPVPVLELMKRRGTRLLAAGGFIRSIIANEKVNDIDLFSPSKEEAWDAARELENGNAKTIYTTDNAYSVRLKRGVLAQFIHRWTFNKPEDMLNSFDFTIACAAFWYNPFDGAWQSMVDDRFYADLAAKRLIYRVPVRNEDAGGSLLRVLKFYQRGYRIPLNSLGAVIARLVNAVDEEKIGQFEGNHEQKLAKVLTALLHEVDPAIDPEHIAHLPSDEEN